MLCSSVRGSWTPAAVYVGIEVKSTVDDAGARRAEDASTVNDCETKWVECVYTVIDRLDSIDCVSAGTCALSLLVGKHLGHRYRCIPDRELGTTWMISGIPLGPCGQKCYRQTGVRKVPSWRCFFSSVASFFCVACGSPMRATPDVARATPTSARRRRERRIRSFFRHEQVAILIAVVSAQHHSAQRCCSVATQTDDEVLAATYAPTASFAATYAASAPSPTVE